MRYLIPIFLCLFIFLAGTAMGQDDTDSPKVREVFMMVEEMPEFPGGQMALLNYIFKNVKYPKAAFDNKTQGVAVVKIVVEADGSVKDMELEKNPGDGLGEEALRVVKQMAKEFTWQPGKQRGKEVAVLMKLPIKFKLDDDFVEPEEEIVKKTIKGNPEQLENGKWVRRDTFVTYYPERYEEMIEVKTVPHEINLSNSEDDDLKPLIVLYNKKGELIKKSKDQDLDTIDPNNIDKVEVVKGEKAIDEFGEAGKNGVVKIFLIKE